jgi:opacity protein-like surface antigen
MKQHLLFVLATVLFTLSVKAQKQPTPVTISVFNEATAIPFTKLITTPVHPGIQAGTSFSYKERKRSHLFQTINIGYIFHRNLYHGFFINTELGYDYKLNFGLNIKGNFGIGYLRTFTTQKEYQFKNGKYNSGSDKGNSRLMASVSTGLGYRLQKKNLYSPEIFMLYQGWAEYPYSPGFIPVMTHINTQIGTKFFINQK